MYQKEHLLAIKGASKKEDRPALRTVQFKNGKTTATDSYKLIEVLTKDKGKDKGNHKPFCVDIDYLKDLKNFESFEVKPNGTTVDFKTENNLVKTPVFGGEYPKTDQLWPKNKPVAEVHLNPRLLKDLIDVYSAFCKVKGMKNHQPIKLSIYAKDVPIKIEATNDDVTIRSLIMPVRIN